MSSRIPKSCGMPTATNGCAGSRELGTIGITTMPRTAREIAYLELPEVGHGYNAATSRHRRVGQGGLWSLHADLGRGRRDQQVAVAEPASSTTTRSATAG